MTCRSANALIATALFLLQAVAAQTGNQPAPPQARTQSAAQSDRGLTVKQVGTGLAPDGKGQLWAVIVGISSYKNVPPEGQLRFAHRDAEELAAFLRSPRGGSFPSNHIKLLLNQDATLSAIRTAIGTWLVRSAEPEDVVYIFFAGHGVVEGESDGYLLAHDSDPQNLYATALQVAELDRIITQRLHARVVVLMADACHAGQIGWASRGELEKAAITKYLDEVGKSGAGVFRLLASRANERSFEDARWGGGHGAFTHFLLEGLKGKGDRDNDGFVRVGELLDYLSAVVPEETRALQHPRFAGSVDPRLPLSIVSVDKASDQTSTATVAKGYSLELHGTPGSEVYIDNSYRGKIRPNGTLLVDNLASNRHEVSIDPPDAEAFSQTISLVAARTLLELKPPAVIKGGGSTTTVGSIGRPKDPNTTTTSSTVNNSSPLVARIREAVARNQVLEPGGAWAIYKQLVRETPAEPMRAYVEISLTTSLEEIGQQAINAYIRSSVLQLRASDFKRGAEAFKCLRSLNPSDTQLETKQLFCEARVAIDEGKNQDAIASLNKAIALDPRAGHSYNALGVAYEKLNDNEHAVDAYRHAAELAPQWSFPHLHLGIQYFSKGKLDRAESEFETAVRLDPRDPFAGWWLVRCYRERNKLSECEQAAMNLIRAVPTFASVHVDLGLIYESSRQYSKAANEFDAYLRLAPTSPDAALIKYNVDKVREFAAKNRKLAGGNKHPSLKKP